MLQESGQPVVPPTTGLWLSENNKLQKTVGKYIAKM